MRDFPAYTGRISSAANVFWAIGAKFTFTTSSTKETATCLIFISTVFNKWITFIDIGDLTLSSDANVLRTRRRDAINRRTIGVDFTFVTNLFFATSFMNDVGTSGVGIAFVAIRYAVTAANRTIITCAIAISNRDTFADMVGFATCAGWKLTKLTSTTLVV